MTLHEIACCPYLKTALNLPRAAYGRCDTIVTGEHTRHSRLSALILCMSICY